MKSGIKFDDVLNFIINVVFMFFGDRIKGLRTIIVAIGTVIVGAWEWITGSGLFAFLCSTAEYIKALSVFCTVTEGKFYATIVIIIASISAILRKLTDTPLGVSEMTRSGSPLEMTAKKATKGGAWLGTFLACAFFFLFAFIILPWLIFSIF